MLFIGREAELAALEANAGGFIVIYGRRRIGKTGLIKEFIKNKTAFYFLATEEVESQAMKRFSAVLSRTTGNPMLQNVVFSDWIDLFCVVAEHRVGEEKVLVMDEFPYLVKTNPAFPSILQYAWDEILKDKGITLILCGSLIGMMYKHALAYDSPLYGRRAAQIRLMSLPFPDVYRAQNRSFSEAVERYSITGGVPKYMEFFEQGVALMKQVEDVILSKNGFLYEEPNFLLKDEVQSPINYFSIMKVIADGNHRLGKIATVLGLQTSTLSPYLSTLIELGFIVKNTPITEKTPEKSRKGLYFISDNFVRFWFRYVYPYKGELELDNTQIVLEEINKDFIEKFVAFSYEDICKSIFADLCRQQIIDFIPSQIGSYWRNDGDHGEEIDIVAVDHRQRQVFFGECKYHTKPVDVSVYLSLEKKVRSSAEIRDAFPGYRFRYGIFSKSGFTERLQKMRKEDLLLFNGMMRTD